MKRDAFHSTSATTRFLVFLVAFGLITAAVPGAWAAKVYKGPSWYVDGIDKPFQDGSKTYPFKTIERAMPLASVPPLSVSNPYWLPGHVIYVKKAPTAYQPPCPEQTFYGTINQYEPTNNPTPAPAPVTWPLSFKVPVGLKIVGTNPDVNWTTPVTTGNEPIIDSRTAVVFHADGMTLGNAAFAGTGAALFDGLSFIGGGNDRMAYFNFVNVGPNIKISNCVFDSHGSIFSGSASLTVEGCAFGDGIVSGTNSIFFYGVLDQVADPDPFRRSPLIIRKNKFFGTTIYQDYPTFPVGSMQDPDVRWVSVVENRFLGLGKDINREPFGAILMQVPTELKDSYIEGYAFGLSCRDSSGWSGWQKTTHFVDGNTIADCQYGIDYTVGARAEVTNNVIERCNYGIYIQPAVYYSYLWAANNTLRDNGLAIEAPQTARGAIANNLFYGNGTAVDCMSLGYYIGYIATDFNAFTENTTSYSGGCFPDDHDYFLPSYADLKLQPDGLHLLPDSLLIDKGTASVTYYDDEQYTNITLGAPNHDIDGDRRPMLVTWDIGADEYMPPAAHVSSISISLGRVGRYTKKVNVTVAVVDNSGAPVPGATVFGTLSGPSGETTLPTTLSGLTDATGKAVLVYLTPNASLTRGNYTYCVDNIQKSGYLYDSGSNAVNCATTTY